MPALLFEPGLHGLVKEFFPVVRLHPQGLMGVQFLPDLGQGFDHVGSRFGL